jgi:hypothetical protein
VDLISLEVIFLQETLGVSESVVSILASFLPGWDFAAADAKGRSGGLATGWLLKKCNFESVWGFESGIGLNFFLTDLGHSMTIINIYGPYLDRQRYWNSITKCTWFSERDVIIGGYFNFSFGVAEVWCTRDVPDPLTNYFKKKLDPYGLIDVEPSKQNPTSRNRRVGDDRVEKRLDRFLVAEGLIESLALFKQWVLCGGEYDHSPIVMELWGRGRRAPSPFNFLRAGYRIQITKLYLRVCGL